MSCMSSSCPCSVKGGVTVNISINKFDRIMFRHVRAGSASMLPAMDAAEKTLVEQITTLAASRADWNAFFQKLHFVVNHTPSGKVVLTVWSQSYKETNLINAFATRISDMLWCIVGQIEDTYGFSFYSFTLSTGNYGALKMIKGVTYKEVPFRGLKLTKTNHTA